MKKKNQLPKYLYRIVSKEEWEKSLLQNDVATSDLDKEFIHLALEEQLPHITQKYWKGKSYITLKISPKKLIGRLLYEKNPGGTTYYYHLHEGKIPLDAVVDTFNNIQK